MYAPSPHAYRVSTAVVGVDTRTQHRMAADFLGPLLGSDEASLARALTLERASSKDAWSRGRSVVSTAVVAHYLWDAIRKGGPRLFEVISLVQYQWLSGAPERFVESSPVRFRPYWKAPRVALSGTMLARRLNTPGAAAMSRPRLTSRRRASLSNEEADDAIERAVRQAANLDRASRRKREALLQAVHLFARACETTDWTDALLFYSAAIDTVAGLARRRVVLGPSDRAAMENLFPPGDPRHQRVRQLLQLANQWSLKEGFQAAAGAAGVHFDARTFSDVERLYKMRNDLVHRGKQPPADIFALFGRGLSVLDQALSRLLASA